MFTGIDDIDSESSNELLDNQVHQLQWRNAISSGINYDGIQGFAYLCVCIFCQF